MKKTVGFLTATLLFSTVAFGTAFAAEEKAGDSTTTDAIVNFRAGGTDPEDGGPEKPTHPDKPGIEVEPEGEPGGNQGTGGSLSLDFAPHLNFKTNAISTKDETYFAEVQKGKEIKPGETKPAEDAEVQDMPNFVQLTDKRGTGEGWDLSVTQLGQFETESGKVLTGAEILFLNSEVMSSIEDKEQTPKITYTGEAVQIGKDSTVSTPLLSAAKGKGMGQFQIKFGTSQGEETASKSVQLKVPGKTVKYAQAYKTTLNWNLTSAVENYEV